MLHRDRRIAQALAVLSHAQAEHVASADLLRQGVVEAWGSAAKTLRIRRWAWGKRADVSARVCRSRLYRKACAALTHAASVRVPGGQVLPDRRAHPHLPGRHHHHSQVRSVLRRPEAVSVSAAASPGCHTTAAPLRGASHDRRLQVHDPPLRTPTHVQRCRHARARASDHNGACAAGRRAMAPRAPPGHTHRADVPAYHGRGNHTHHGPCPLHTSSRRLTYAQKHCLMLGIPFPGLGGNLNLNIAMHVNTGVSTSTLAP
jgi:hypothetical protein